MLLGKQDPEAPESHSLWETDHGLKTEKSLPKITKCLLATSGDRGLQNLLAKYEVLDYRTEDKVQEWKTGQQAWFPD